MNQELFNIEYLIFSSHKTATQTLLETLNSNNIRSLHCHLLENINLAGQDFDPYLREYHRIRGKKLTVISVFRDPLDRMISSFFQWYGTRPIRTGEVTCHTQTLVFRANPEELQELFYDFCLKIDGFGESIDHMCAALNIDPAQLAFSPVKMLSCNDLEHCQLLLSRFDLLLANLPYLLKRITEKEVDIQTSNISQEKWYANHYKNFKKNVRIHESVLVPIYERRSHLMNLFFPGRYEEIVREKINRYSKGMESFNP